MVYHILYQSIFQPGKVAKPARVVSWTGKINISLFPFAPENLVSRDRFSRPVPRQPAHSPYWGWTWCLLTELFPISTAAAIYLYRRASSGHALLAYRWRSLPRVRRHRGSKSQGSSSNGCCDMRLSFPTTSTIAMKWARWNIGQVEPWPQELLNRFVLIHCLCYKEFKESSWLRSTYSPCWYNTSFI